VAAVGVLSVRIADAGSLTPAEELSLLLPMRPKPLGVAPAVPTGRCQFAGSPADSAGPDSEASVLRGESFDLHQAALGRVSQAGVLDDQRCLVGKRSGQLHILIRELARLAIERLSAP
jgi:hypothetical protein